MAQRIHFQLAFGASLGQHIAAFFFDLFKAFGQLTTGMMDKYNGSPNPPNQLGVVLDGVVVSSPYVKSPTTTGQTQISGGFDQTSATNLANQLTYGALPLSFVQAALGAEVDVPVLRGVAKLKVPGGTQNGAVRVCR